MRGSYCALSGKRLLVSALIVLTLFAPGTVFCASQKVALFPFQMNSSQNLDYLQNGMFSMLAARLTDPGKVSVIGRDTIDQVLAKAKSGGQLDSGVTQTYAKMLANSLGADYAIFGTITIIGQSVSLDAVLADVKGERENLTFSDHSKVMGDVISLVNNFAVTANREVFNREVQTRIFPPAQSTGAVVNPVKTVKTVDAGDGLRSVEQPSATGFLTRLSFKDVIRAMAAGDLDNNGRTQVVVATENILSIYYLKGGALVLEQTLEYPSSLSIVGLDIADINNNGYPEIFVSAMTVHQDSLASFVVEFNGDGYTVLAQDQSMYFKVVRSGKNSNMLLGQEKGADPFAGKIYLMAPNPSGYTKVKPIPLPSGTSVLALDRSGDGAQFLSVNRHGRLVVTTDTGDMAWQSTLRYGGTNKVWLLEREDEDESYRERIYFNPRVRFLARSGGSQKAVVIRNGELLGGTVGRYKSFEQGHIEIMAWNGMEMAPVYKTTPVQGWISDFDVADLDNDGTPELIAAVVGRSKFVVWGKDKGSTIISYDLK